MIAETTRRESLELLSIAGFLALTGCGGTAEAGEATATNNDGGQGDAGGAPGECAARPETTVGPFPNLSPLERKDVRGNTRDETLPKKGADLTLRVRVMDLDSFCAPLEGAVVDVWQCDALGVYAGYSAFGSIGEDFGRGFQRTNVEGVAEFLTIFPGSYAGRALHIHFSIRADEGTLAPNASGQSVTDVFVAQLYFEIDVATEIFKAFPIYQEGAPITPNEADGLFRVGGRDLIVEMTKDPAGYRGEVTVGVRRSDIGL